MNPFSFLLHHKFHLCYFIEEWTLRFERKARSTATSSIDIGTCKYPFFSYLSDMSFIDKFEFTPSHKEAERILNDFRIAFWIFFGLNLDFGASTSALIEKKGAVLVSIIFPLIQCFFIKVYHSF